MKTFFLLQELKGTMQPGIADLTKIHDRIYELNRINIPRHARGNGYGSRLLSMVCAEADARRVTLRCYSLSSGPLSNEQLDAWYARYGFMESDDSYLYRLPKL